MEIMRAGWRTRTHFAAVPRWSNIERELERRVRRNRRARREKGTRASLSSRATLKPHALLYSSACYTGYNLGRNKMRNPETSPPLPSPKINDEFALKPKRAFFPLLKWGEGWS